jgi:pyrroloquinoline quinone (PQQ) biosynthesis protein C
MTSSDCLVSAPPRPDSNRSLAALVNEAEGHKAVRHPWLQAFANGTLPDPAAAVRDFAVTYRGYSAWFTRYLQMVIERQVDPRHKDLLGENLAEEKGELHPEDKAALAAVGIDPATVEGIPHSRLFRDFCHSLGISDQELADVQPAAARWRERFLLGLQQGTPAFCCGALGLGTEGIVRTVYRQLLAGIQKATTLTRPEYLFFELHCLVDDQHQKDLLSIAEDQMQEPGGYAQLRAGMRFALDLRSEFWDALHERALRMGRAA